MLPRTQKAHVKQNPVKKAVVAIAMAAPSALKSRAPMQTPLVLSQVMLHLPPIAIQRRMEVINARVVVAIDADVVAGNVLSAAKVQQKHTQQRSLVILRVAHGLPLVWLAHRQPYPPAN
jgi:hypothetical protein